MSYVNDPVTKKPVPLHVLWDSNVLRSTSLEEIDRHAKEFVEKHPRASFPELKGSGEPAAFEKWAKESNKIATDWAFGIQTVSDPNKDQDTDRLVKNMVKFILEGVAPVDKAPDVPAEYWEKLQSTTERRITLAGYRLADLIVSAADQIAEQRKFVGR